MSQHCMIIHWILIVWHYFRKHKVANKPFLSISQVTLPDHDFPIGEKHKLIPSVYASCEIKDKKITFNGPTYIAIQSAKHDSSTAQTHQYDFEKIMELEEFKHSVKNKNGDIKPILCVAVDGGPDESPSNHKTLLAWCNRFKKEDIDAIFVFSNAPGWHH